ncbi:MAG: hypothetical protein ACOCUI_01905 [bacterium]
MKNFLDLVKERPDENLKIDEFICPFCDSTEVEKLGGHTTLVAGSGDPNHVWTFLRCKKCGNKSTHEHIDYNTWYTLGIQGSKILKGIPSCFENYIYTCKFCNGEVVRKYYGKKSNKKVKVLSTILNEETGEFEKQYKTVFECRDCKKSIESDVDYWTKGMEQFGD